MHYKHGDRPPHSLKVVRHFYIANPAVSGRVLTALEANPVNAVLLPRRLYTAYPVNRGCEFETCFYTKVAVQLHIECVHRLHTARIHVRGAVYIRILTLIKTCFSARFPALSHKADAYGAAGTTVLGNAHTDNSTALACGRAYGRHKQQMHKGIDIRAKHDDVLATENGGKVVSVNHNTNTGGGKSVTVEYARADGSKVQTTYMHLDSIAVKVGDEVKAGQKLGVSGNTGTRTTGEHLHFGVKNISADGKTRDVDPASYMAEIAQKGNLKQQALYNGKDLLAKYKDNGSGVDTSLSPDDWMKKLLSSEDVSTGLSSADPIMGLVTTMYGSLLALAVQIDNKSEEEQKAQISEAVSKRQVDLKPLVPTMKECVLSVGDNGKAVLSADNGTTKVTRILTNAEFSRLSQVLGDTNLSNEAKKMRIAGMVNTIVLTRQASQNYEQVLEQQEGQSQTMQRK